MLNLRRRALLHLLASAAAVPAVSPLARAQSYPSRPVTLVVFVPAGGTPDIIARLVGQSLSQRLGQSVVIDNRPGGGGNVALQAVARAPADGYSLLLVATPHAVNVTLYEKSAVTVTRDIVPVASINTDSFVLLVNPSFPARTVAEFITHAKDNPGKINAFIRRAVSDDDRRRGGARSLSRYAGRALGINGGRCACDVRCHCLGASADPVGCVASDWGNGHSPRAGAAGHPADRRYRRGLRRDRLAWHRRPQGHAGRDRRAAQSRYQRGAC
ncbi:MAG: hypothetical protein E6G80_07230 [Alphaproteobacteria bacterium]|nr:MAG: hypothetical protein E6G80_07230 [Alphaproteobacteria bacterium]